MLSVTQIYDWAASQLHESSTDTQLTTLLLRWVNEGLGDVARAAPWQWLEAQENITFGGHGAGVNTTNGVTYLPPRVWRIQSVWPGSRGYREPLQIIGAWELDAVSPSTVLGTVSDFLVVWGYYGVAQDNPATGVLTFADAGASAASARVHGVDNNGNEATEDVVVNGGVTVNQYAAGPEGVRRIHLIDSTVVAGTGVVTVLGGDGATNIETLPAAAGVRSYERLRTELSPAPTAATDHLVRYFKRIRQVVDGDDEVELPYEFEGLLWDALSRRLSLFKREFDAVGYFEQRFAKGVRELKRFQNRQPGRLWGMKQLASYGASMLYRG